MMKNIFRYTLVAVSCVALLTSCKDFLDTEPSDAVPSDKAIASYTDAVTALTGAYDALQGSSSRVDYYGARMVYFGDVQADLVQARQSDKRSSSCYEMRYTIDDAPAIWRTPYSAISRANNVITAIEAGKVPLTGGVTQESVDALKGEAMFIRALAHFDVCRIYSKPYTIDSNAPGIPMVTKPMTAGTVLALVSDRSTVAKVYDFIIAELKAAATLINKTTKSTGYATTWSCEALLARVYLYKGDNTNAFSTAVNVIENSPYKLWENADYASSWSVAGNSELIFEIVNFNTSDWVDREAIGYLYSENGYDDMVVTPKLTNYFAANPNDVRGNAAIVATDPGLVETYGDAKVFVNKFPGREDFNFDSRVNNIPVLRMSEMYLTAAEAAQKLGNGQADKYINEIAKRNPGTVYTNVTLDQILWERGIELFGEGHRKFDLLRNGKEIDRTERWSYTLNPESVKYDNTYFRALLPIPKVEIDANPSLKSQQNPGYGN